MDFDGTSAVMTGGSHCDLDILNVVLDIIAAPLSSMSFSCCRHWQLPRWHKFPSLSSYDYSELSSCLSVPLSLFLLLFCLLQLPVPLVWSQANQNSSANHHPIGWKIKRGKGLLVCFERLVHLKYPEGVSVCVSQYKYVRKRAEKGQ